MAVAAVLQQAINKQQLFPHMS